MLRGNMPSSRMLFGRIGLFFVISAMFLTITAAGANAAGFSFMDSVIGFFGYAPVTQTAAPVSAPAPVGDAPTLSQLLVEDFSYTAATLLTANGWTAHSGGGTNAITVANGGLTYSGYPSSGIGNAAQMTTSGEDDNRTFTAQTSGTVYMAAMVNVSAAQTTGDYFLHFAGTPVSSDLKGRLWAKRDASNNLAFGISKASASPTYTGFTYALNTTYLMVIKYSIVSGATNDTVDLFINPTLNGIEPVATISAPDPTGLDAANLTAVALRQGNGAQSCTPRVDGIRVGLTWADATSTLYQLSVGRAGSGSGTVTSNPAGISCGADCTEDYNSGQVVTLTAVPDSSSSFAGWTGEPCAGLPENCDVTMDQARSVTATFNVAATPTATATPTTCFADDNGTGTIDLPAPCRYMGGPMPIITPPGQPTQSVGSLERFTNVTRAPGGSLGGEVETGDATFGLAILAGVAIPRFISVTAEMHSGPRTPGNPIQSFPTDMFRLQGQLPAGDPDFDLLRITGGSSFGLPSPGHTTLTQLPGGMWAVDSFFDVFYTIDYVGRPGGPYGGMSGSTTGTIRMTQSSGPRQTVDCMTPDNGTGTTDLPAPCPVQGWPMTISNGLPPGTTLHSDAFFDVFTNIVRSPGGSLGGESDQFMGTMSLDMCGTGSMAGYCRTIPIPNTQTVMDSAPRAPGQPVQSFDTEMFMMFGQITGDPDFDLLRITGGTQFGMPSPGHTTLTRQPGGTTWAVDSFFDITYRIDFVGRPGGALSGMSGSTTGTIRMQQGTPGPRSITVIKLNDTTGDPLPGWTMNLYGGPGCTGSLLDTQVTGPNGLADFVGLTNGDYSVEEVMQGGWTPAGPVCQDMTLSGGSGGGGSGGCGSSCGYPPTGDDTFPSGAHVTVELQGMPTMHLTSNGPTLVHRGPPCTACGPGGRTTIDTEMLAMDLQGNSPVGPFMIRESPTRPSLGQIRQQAPGTDFPADSFFDVFFEMDTAMGTLHNDQPLQMTSVIDGIPPVNSLYRGGPTMTIPLLTSLNMPVGVMRYALHVPLPSGEIFIVFRNVPPPATATATATPTPINHSITVLKVNDTTGLPLPGWTMNLYSGAGCTGSLLDTQVTDSNGIVDFLNLSAGSYSVGEVNQVGWTPMSGVCQDVGLTGRPGRGSGPASGDMPSLMEVMMGGGLMLDLQGMPQMHLTGSGPATIESATACPGCTYDTEMLQMSLSASSPIGPFMIRESPTRQSTGRVTPQTQGVPFPADSFFDVFFEIDLPSGGGTLHTTQPYTATAQLSDGTTENKTYSGGCSQIPLFDSTGQPAGSMSCFVFVPLYPDETFIIFRNQPPPATPTNTATSTPTPINHSITVLKVNDTTGLPLPGWTMNLYSGAGCTGSLLDTQVTDSNGIVDFLNLSAGSYSVGEVNQVGWTPMSGVCQDVGLTGRSSGSGAPPMDRPDVEQRTYTGGRFALDIAGFTPATLVLTGDSNVHYANQCVGCGPGGRSTIDTEMLSMDLTGSSSVFGPVHIRESPSRPSLGQIRQQQAGVDFPADSFFDIFVEMDTALGTFHTEQPVHVQAVVDGIPPINDSHSSGCSTTPLFDSSNQPVGTMSCTVLVPLNPDETFIVFRNQPPAPTATNTATSTPTATPTNTPTNCVVPDNGTGTIDLPAPCRYLGGPLHITDGLPSGTELLSAGSLDTFTEVVTTPGGSLGGARSSGKASMQLMMRGTGTQSSFQRLMEIPISSLEMDSGPRTPGDPVQSFDTSMFRLQGQIPAGDPDFDLLRITAGSDFSLPSPGHTTLTRQGPPGSSWAVDSFFDITYRIDFVGKPGGALSGMSGSTTATIRMEQHELRPRLRVACTPLAASGTVTLPAECAMQGWPMSVIDGLPQGTTLQSDAFFDVFYDFVRTPGGPMGGERDEFKGTLTLDMCGTGTMAGYCRPIPIPISQAVMDSAPRTPGQPVQSFDTDMFAMQGQLPPGDPDFDLLRITAGTGFGMPSPGHTTLTCVSGAPTCDVDSFFDITYRIDFIGRPGGPLGGMSGSTTGTIRMYQGLPSAGPTPTSTATNTPTPSVDFCSNPVTAGQAAQCSTGSDATSSDTTVTDVTIPTGAAPSSFTLTLTETNNPSPPTGFTACGQLVDIDAQGVTLTSPATITFHIDVSVSACGEARPEVVSIFRDGVPVPDCNGSNDPCVSSRSGPPNNDKVIICHSTHFSEWFAAVNDSTISGTVTYGNPVTGPNPRGVPDVLLSGAGSPAVADTTVAAGTYSLTGFGAFSYTITPSKSGGINGAITSFDAGRIAQYITGNTGFTAAQATVADVSGAGGLSSFDAALIARYVASLPPPTGNSGTWIFSPTSNFHATVTSDITSEDYAGLLMGDVSGNWGDPSPFRPVIGGNGPERNAAVNAPTLVTPADNEVVIPVAVQGVANKDVISYEFDLRYDPLVIQPQENPVDVAETVSSGLSTVVNAETPGLLRVVAYGPMPIDGNGLLLNLRFTAVGAPGTVSPLTWERFMLNEGTPRITVADGQVELVRSLPNQAEISGRLLTSFGAGVPNSRVTLTDTAGRSRSILSNGFGVYRFGNLQVGQTYTIRVNAREHAFAPATVSVTGQIVNVDMIAEQ